MSKLLLHVLKTCEDGDTQLDKLIDISSHTWIDLKVDDIVSHKDLEGMYKVVYLKYGMAIVESVNVKNLK